MHRRARHLNPASAGASLVLDARYINLADKTAVSRWTDRSVNNFNIVQPTGSQQPTFETNVLNGNNSLRFISTANQFLCGGDILDVGTNNFAAIVIGRSTNNNQGFYAKTDLGITNGAFTFFRSAGSGRSYFGNGATGIFVDNTSISDSFLVMTQVVTRGNYIVSFVNGVSGTQNTTSIVTTNFTPTYPFEVGNLGQGFYPLSGFISQLIIFTTPETYALNYKASPLLKRIEHASAFSFKLPCA